jgi:thioesterase domain-containing protein
MRDLGRLYEAFRSHAEALEDYVPLPFETKVQLFVADEGGPDEIRAVTDEWRALTQREPDVTVLPGTHYTALRMPNVRTIANRIRDGLH